MGYGVCFTIITGPLARLRAASIKVYVSKIFTLFDTSQGPIWPKQLHIRTIVDVPDSCRLSGPMKKPRHSQIVKSVLSNYLQNISGQDKCLHT